MSRTEAIDRRQPLRRIAALVGGVISVPTVAGVLNSCEPLTGPDWSPQTLSSVQNQMVDTISEIIIPATDTP